MNIKENKKILNICRDEIKRSLKLYGVFICVPGDDLEILKLVKPVLNKKSKDVEICQIDF